MDAPSGKLVVPATIALLAERVTESTVSVNTGRILVEEVNPEVDVTVFLLVEDVMGSLATESPDPLQAASASAIVHTQPDIEIRRLRFNINHYPFLVTVIRDPRRVTSALWWCKTFRANCV
ncbi:hypothetical protein IMCC26256_11107 [Actinobacteria bacterium IMCC26256]|nr:hypothetical protein IMCC26256_11107 [Actinobacteria bacterium IMCC26256]